MDKNTVKTSFGKWVGPINFDKVQKNIDLYKQDHYTKKLTTHSFILLMLYAHLTEMASLHAMEIALADDNLQKAVGFTSISVSQLSRKNNEVDPAILSSLFMDLVGQLNARYQPPKTKMPLKIIDSTTIPLNVNHFKWAEFRKTKSGYKLHLRLVFNEEGSPYPDKEVMTNAKEHDRGQLEVLVDDKEAMYVFDRGYVDYKRFDSFTDDGLFFVCRVKKNAVIRVVEEFSLPQGSPVLKDQMVYIGSTVSRTENVFRIVDIIDSRGKEMRLITNRFDLPAEEISEIYRSRWAIELFFKWIKQHVKIKHFFGMSENAVKNQIYLALITYCLVVLIQAETKSQKSLLKITRWLKALLWKEARHWLRRFEKADIP